MHSCMAAVGCSEASPVMGPQPSDPWSSLHSLNTASLVTWELVWPSSQTRAVARANWSCKSSFIFEKYLQRSTVTEETSFYNRETVGRKKVVSPGKILGKAVKCLAEGNSCCEESPGAKQHEGEEGKTNLFLFSYWRKQSLKALCRETEMSAMSPQKPF